jgi:tetratricopeptide (TPR) repeat protein
MILHFARRYDQAIEEYRKVIDLDPNFTRARLWLGWALVQKGDCQDALAEFQKSTALDPRSTQAIAGLGYAYALSGQRGAAWKTIDELKELSGRRYVPPPYIALIHAGLGERDQAFSWLQRACQLRDNGMPYALKANPVWDGLRADPRFAELLQCFGVPP